MNRDLSILSEEQLPPRVPSDEDVAEPKAVVKSVVFVDPSDAPQSGDKPNFAKDVCINLVQFKLAHHAGAYLSACGVG